MIIHGTQILLDRKKLYKKTIKSFQKEILMVKVPIWTHTFSKVKYK